ncbi:BAG family molecular chaperone regulator 1-like [Brassica rapa]|uniref:BAG family molecular chaperone regulator 1-like n=1 Tax=Brassica campestris TaxID=3711 RepID=UPI00142D770D|nr:BAG family molecular chaperone regulator 1-like [Brassica rapa]
MGNQEESRMGRISDEVAKLSNKGGTRAEDKEFVVLIELLTMEMLKLDEIEADGELRVQRKRESNDVFEFLLTGLRVQRFVESLDVLRVRNRDMNRSANSQDMPLPRLGSLCFSLAPKASTIITQDWELFA